MFRPAILSGLMHISQLQRLSKNFINHTPFETAVILSPLKHFANGPKSL